VRVHVGGTPKVVPGSANPLYRHPIVEQTADYPKSNQISEGVEAPLAGSAARRLDRRSYKLHTVPVTQLMRGTSRQTTCLLSRERFQVPLSLFPESSASADPNSQRLPAIPQGNRS